MLSACCTNVCCSAVTCDSVTALRLTFNFWCPHPFTFLLHRDHHSFVLLYICLIVHSFIFPLSVWVIVSYIPLMADEAVCTGVVGSSGSTRVTSPICCLSKTCHLTPHHSSSSCTGHECRNWPSATVPCVPCIRCAKRFAGAPGYICEWPNAHQKWLQLPKCFIHGVNVLQHLAIKQLRAEAASVEQGLSRRWQSQRTTEYEEATSDLQSTQAAFTKWLEAFKRKESCQSKQPEGIQVVTQLRRLNYAAKVLAHILAKVISPPLPFACFFHANCCIESSWGATIWGRPYQR